MSYEIAGEGRESIGQFASNAGYAALSRAVMGSENDFPYLASFIEHGATKDVDRVREDLTEFASEVEGDVASTANGMSKLLKGIQIAVITDGTE